MMASIVNLQSKFFCDMMEAAKLSPDNGYSVLFSVLFLPTTFILLSGQFHKHADEFTSWKSKIFKHVVFHWTYFYTTRLWFIFLKVCRWITKYSDKVIEVSILMVSPVYRQQRNFQKMSSDQEITRYNKLIIHSCISLLVLGIAMIPGLILLLRYFNRHDIPNFLMWAGEDPWIRSEMGTSGHYLERSPRTEVYNPHKHNVCFRTGRSSSVDTNVYLQKRSSSIRSSLP
ncbi:uncharacterized protein [Euwallacea similis]|uniref:uncharacterized protein isoform X2 n=1 Tax=Euwallacea similis TaxID=1736056 RepID=UPI00344E2D3B